MTRPIEATDLLHLTSEQAKEIFAQGEEAVIWALLKLSLMAQGKKAAPTLSTPSSQVPPYQKPAADKTKPKKRGRPAGHPGTRRRKPLTIDRHEEHKLACCPDCGGAVGDSYAQRKRIIEDIEVTTCVTTEHTIHTHYCANCKQRVSATVPDALPKSTIGNRALSLSAYMHYSLGMTTSKVVELLDLLFHFPVTGGGLCGQWHRLADLLWPWYDEIAQQARTGAVLHVDETGWRVNGKTHWLWCFTSPDLTYYVIDRSRGAEMLREFLRDSYAGTLVTDFFAAYDAIVVGDRQLCLVHLLRELKQTGARNQTPEWRAFHQRLRRLLDDALRLARRPDRLAADFAAKRERLHARLDALCAERPSEADAARLTKRLVKHREGLLTFLDNPAVPFDNNRAEREIRPAVIARKNSFQNASERGATTQAALMSIFRTLKLRKHDLLEIVGQAVRQVIVTGSLPPLPGHVSVPPPQPDG